MLWIILALFVVGGFVYVCKYDDYHNIYNNHNGRRPDNSAHGSMSRQNMTDLIQTLRSLRKKKLITTIC